jgi:hypothetical protein
MSYKPSDSYSKEFVTSSPTTGAAADADSTPAATADFDGSGTGSMALTVTHIDTGRYKITGTIPAGRVKGDVLNVSVAATVGGVAGKAIVDTQVLDSKRVGDLADAAALTDYQQRGVAVTLPSLPAVTLATSQPNYAPAKAGDAMALTTAERNAAADALLTRDWTAVAGTPAARSALNALRFLRNHWKILTGTLTVYQEDDVTSAWSKPVVTDGNAAPVTEIGP